MCPNCGNTTKFHRIAEEVTKHTTELTYDGDDFTEDHVMETTSKSTKVICLSCNHTAPQHIFNYEFIKNYKNSRSN